MNNKSKYLWTKNIRRVDHSTTIFPFAHACVYIDSILVSIQYKMSIIECAKSKPEETRSRNIS